ncbi:SH3 domain-containing protein [Loktanella salsilacus]
MLDTLPRGTQTEVVESDDNGWVRVRVVGTGQMGWMAERLLTGG